MAFVTSNGAAVIGRQPASRASLTTRRAHLATAAAPTSRRRAWNPATTTTAPTTITTTPTMKEYVVGINLDGKDYDIPCDDDQTFLDAIEEYGLVVPYSCRAGVCMTCAAKIVRGEVDLGEAALGDEGKNEGFVLCCSGFPKSDGIYLEMNKFDDAYNMQYGQYEK